MIKLKKRWVGMIGLMLLASHVFSQKKISIVFQVERSDRHTVTVHWIRPEEDSFDYVLEKSGDEKTWERIENLSAQLSPCYDFIDLQAAEGVNYYRIVQRNHEELVATSETTRLQAINVDEVYIWPTPANNILHIRSPFVNGTMDIIDTEGRFIRKIAISDFIIDVPLQALPTGMYFIHIRHGKDIFVAKFIKQPGW
jgi:hypothetical protein